MLNEFGESSEIDVYLRRALSVVKKEKIVMGGIARTGKMHRTVLGTRVL